MAALHFPSRIARPTMPMPQFIEPRIFFSPLVAVNALSGWAGNASSRIFFIGYCLKVIWADAQLISAKMIDYKPLGDLSPMQFVGKTMCWDDCFPIPKLPILSIAAPACSPDPAVFSFSKLRKKSIHGQRIALFKNTVKDI